MHIFRWRAGVLSKDGRISHLQRLVLLPESKPCGVPRPSRNQTPVSGPAPDSCAAQTGCVSVPSVVTAWVTCRLWCEHVAWQPMQAHYILQCVHDGLFRLCLLKRVGIIQCAWRWQLLFTDTCACFPTSVETASAERVMLSVLPFAALSNLECVPCCVVCGYACPGHLSLRLTCSFRLVFHLTKQRC